ncbi:unnamed protein product, partial [Iphiclides podalirius]
MRKIKGDPASAIGTNCGEGTITAAEVVASTAFPARAEPATYLKIQDNLHSRDPALPRRERKEPTKLHSITGHSARAFRGGNKDGAASGGGGGGGGALRA